MEGAGDMHITLVPILGGGGCVKPRVVKRWVDGSIDRLVGLVLYVVFKGEKGKIALFLFVGREKRGGGYV